MYLLVSRGACQHVSSGSPRPGGRRDAARRHAPLVPVGALHLGDGDFAAVIAFAPLGRLLHLLGFLFGDGEVGMDVYVSHFDTRLFRVRRSHRD